MLRDGEEDEENNGWTFAGEGEFVFALSLGGRKKATDAFCIDCGRLPELCTERVVCAVLIFGEFFRS